jgi:hypothetical protein
MTPATLKSEGWRPFVETDRSKEEEDPTRDVVAPNDRSHQRRTCAAVTRPGSKRTSTDPVIGLW